jgi:hypothetical protein
MPRKRSAGISGVRSGERMKRMNGNGERRRRERIKRGRSMTGRRRRGRRGT